MLPLVAGCAAVLLMALCGGTALAQNAPDEAAQIAVLKSGAGWLEKQTACRSLRQIGTAASVPALAALLNDKDLANLARFALESMPYPEAGKAFRDALGATGGLPKVGVVISLGERHDAEAVPLLIPLLKDPCADLATAAAGALGRIATPDAVDALFDFRETAPESIQPAVAEGLLAAGQYLVQQGKHRRASELYNELLSADWPLHVRMGAFAGLIAARPKSAPKRLIEALAGKESVLRDMAASIIGEGTDGGATKHYADALPTLPSEGQVALLCGLAARKDRAARPAAAGMLNSADAEVKLAAVKSLGVLGEAEDVPALVALLPASDAKLAEAAKGSLTIMETAGVNPAIAAAVPAATESVRAQLLDLMTERRAEQTVPLALQNLNAAEAPVRAAAWRVLAAMGAVEQLPTALNALKAAADPTERAGIEKALSGICLRGGQDTLPRVLDAMNGAGPDARTAFLRVTAGMGGPKALETVLAALNDADPAVNNEAVSLLGAWATPDAAPHLLGLAQSEDLNRKAVGLRGYLRLAALNPAPDQRADMLNKAMALAQRPEEKKIVLSAWGAFRMPVSLDALEPQLEDPAVQSEAAVAMIAVAADLGKRDPNCKPRAITALNAVAAKCADPDIRARAQQILAGLQ